MRLSTPLLRNQLWVLPALVGLVLVLRWIPTHGQPVRLFEMRGDVVAVRDGWMVVESRRRGQGAGVLVQPVHGGRARLGPVPMGRGHTVRGVQMTPTHLVFLTNTEFRVEPGEAVPAGPRADYRYELHRVPWSGAGLETVRFEGAFGGVLTEEGCFWWGPGEADNCPLKFIPLVEGEARTIGKGAPQSLSRGPNGGVMWRISTPGGREWDAVWVDREGKLVEQIASVEAFFAPELLGDRLYWVERNLAEPIINARPHRIVSSRLDGSDRRDLLQATDTSVQLGEIRAHEGELYITVTENRRMGAGTSPMRQVSLCRILAGEALTLVPVCVLPAGAGSNWFLDGRNAYFPIGEKRENWLDWSPRGLMPQRVTAWYRYRFPAN